MDTVQVQIVDTVQVVNNYMQSSGMDISTWMTVFIAVIALGFSIWQGFVARRHNRLTIRPYLGISFRTIPGEFGLMIKNDGIGPAIIQEFSIKINNKEMFHDFMIGNAEKIRRVIGCPDIIFELACYNKGSYIKPGYSFYLIAFPDSESATKEVIKRVERALESIDIDIKYQSIYKENYRVHT